MKWTPERLNLAGRSTCNLQPSGFTRANSLRPTAGAGTSRPRFVGNRSIEETGTRRPHPFHELAAEASNCPHGFAPEKTSVSAARNQPEHDMREQNPELVSMPRWKRQGHNRKVREVKD